VSIDFKFHTSCVRSISVSPCGNYLASGDESGFVVVWDVRTTRILRKYTLDNKIIDCVEWCPIQDRCLLGVCNEENVYMINPGLYSRTVNRSTNDLLEGAEKIYGQDVLLNDKKEQH
jgi:ribosome biogenesis protein ERB1